jgi:hypothetical protein
VSQSIQFIEQFNRAAGEDFLCTLKLAEDYSFGIIIGKQLALQGHYMARRADRSIEAGQQSVVERR